MRHQLSGRQLSRNASHRHALMRNLAAALIRYESIRTTVPKAKELRRVVEPIITLGKKDTQHARQRAFSMLRDRELVEKLFTEVGPRFASRAGGYTRILKMEPRPGDSADMALMQLVEGAPKAEAPAADAKPKKKAAKKKAAPEGESAEAPKKAPRKKKAAAA